MTHPLPPEEHFRLHFSRSRNFTVLEKTLVPLCTMLAQKGSWEYRNAPKYFAQELKRFHNLAGLDDKTFRNFFTEVSSLFSLYTLEGQIASVGDQAIALADSSDLVQFFVHHMRRFQFPNGHVNKSHVIEQVQKGVKFKPGNYFVRLLLEGQRLVGEERSFGISSDEATWFGTNDLLALTGVRSPEENAQRILDHRKQKRPLSVPKDLQAYGLPSGIKNTPSDFKRYARDCLTMLEFARVVWRGPDARRYLRPGDAISTLFHDRAFFGGFSELSDGGADPDAYRSTVEEWLRYVTKVVDSEEHQEKSLPEIPKIKKIEGSDTERERALHALNVDTKAIGDHGEAIAIEHERNRLRACDRPDLAKRVKKIDDHLGVGYDLESFECDGRPRCVEVKATESVSRVQFHSFHITTNEWMKAEALGSSYFVYRISLSDALGGLKLQVLRDPVGLYKGDKISMVPRKGADITFTEDVAEEVELLLDE